MLQNLPFLRVPAAIAVAAALAPSPTPASGQASFSATIAPPSTYEAITAASSPSLSVRQQAIRYTVANVGNEARYRVRVHLARMVFPNDAVGRTNQVTGAIVIGTDGTIIREGSSFTVDLTSIQSDNQRRDGFIRRNTLKTDSFPKAIFVPTAARGLPATLPATGETTFELTGDLTIHGVTRPATWQVKAARSTSGTVTGSATTSFRFGDYDMTIPKVGMVLSVDDKITLEYDFTLQPQPVTR